ncbi:MAG TPA: tetratricopeptide repeat protein, partial [Pseudolabrys sp.]
MQSHCGKLLRAALITSLVLVAIAGAAGAGPLEDALAARDRGDDATALRLIRPLADQGNAEAQYNLGVMYVAGKGVPRNGEEAAKWFRLAGDQGYAPAQYNLGVMHGSGLGVPQNFGEAAKWYRLAADQG